MKQQERVAAPRRPAAELRAIDEATVALSRLGYRCVRLSARRTRSRAAGNSLAGGDILALTTGFGNPHLLVTVGGGKRLATAFAELRGWPGLSPLVMRTGYRGHWWYVGEHDRFAELVDALAALRSIE